MADTPNIPYNVIILEDNQETLDVVIEAYVELVERCVTSDEILTTLHMLVDEFSVLLTQEIIKLQISKQLELLQEIKERKRLDD